MLKKNLSKAEPEEEVVKLKAPEIEQPKVVDKIDLSGIDSSTRPKKDSKKEIDKTEKEEPQKLNQENRFKTEKIQREEAEEKKGSKRISQTSG